jgi:hypothetical protein
MAAKTTADLFQFGLDFVFYREGEVVMAHCLQTDTTAFGPTKEAAKTKLREALECEIISAMEEGDLERAFASPAPREVWAKIEESVKQRFVVLALRLPDPARPKQSRKREVRLKEFLLEGVA